MKGVVTAATVALALWSAACRPALKEDYLTPVRLAIENIVKTPKFSALATKTLGKLPDYQTLLESTLPEANKYRIDFIFQLHGSLEINTPEFVAMVEGSQRRVVELLDALSPDVVGQEGYFSDPPDEMGDTKSVMSDMGMWSERTEAEFRKLLSEPDKGQLADGVTLYRRSHPRTLVIGIEERELMSLSGMAGVVAQGLPILSDITPELATEYQAHYKDLNRLRSLIALAKMVRKLQISGKKHGIIVVADTFPTSAASSRPTVSIPTSTSLTPRTKAGRLWRKI